MNTGISKSQFRFALACVASLLLAGCVGGEWFSFASATGKEETGGAQIGPIVPKSKSTKLARGTVKITAPKNYCVDDTSIKNSLNGSFARLAKCTALDGKGGAAATSAVMTVNVSPRRPETAIPPTLDDLANAVAPAEILARSQKGALALVHVASGGNEAFAPADPRHWRGATVLDSRLVLLSLYAPKGAPMAGPQGATLLASLARGISATRGGLLGSTKPSLSVSDTQDVIPQATEGAADVAADATVPENDARKGLGRVFGRLFNRS